MLHAFRSTRVATPQGIVPAVVLVEGERITAVAPWASPTGEAIVHDFGDLILMPGLVDTHVHINEPGRTEWEGFETATRAAAGGGVTTLVDMPLNCMPEVTSVNALEAKRAAARGKTWVDWAAWGGVVHGNAGHLKGLVEAGVAGFKCFLIDSGIDGFAPVNESDLRLAFEQLQGTQLPLLAHAETPGPVTSAAAHINAEGLDWRSYATYLASRPDHAEVEAIALLIRLAEEFTTPVHIVHLASPKALPLLAAARERGVPLSVETCAHYLWFAAEEIEDGATEHKCAPPIRNAEAREQLWKALSEGLIDMVTTDHSPCLPAMKRRDEGRWDLAWGGIASLGLALPVLWTAMRKRGLDGDSGIERLCAWLSAAPARLAGLSEFKGAIHAGADADLLAFDPEIDWVVTRDDLQFRHKLSPYLGANLRGRVQETWLRGRCIYRDGQFEGAPEGRERVKA